MADRHDKLYSVIEIDDGRLDLQRGAIEVSVSVDTIVFVQV